jgi:predicted metal-dependent phosphoesterase TrpH
MEPLKLIKTAKIKGLNGIAITDHNTILGGMDVAKRAGSDFYVIVGSEIRTESCEIIGLFLNEEIRSKKTFKVIERIKSQGGLAVLPHPFRSNSLFRKATGESLIRIAEKVDAIEAFNARTSSESNRRAQVLASKVGKPMIAGSDAHFYQEVGNAKTIVPSFNSEEELKRNILEGKTTIEKKSQAFIYSLPFRVLGFLYSKPPKPRR